MDTERIREIAEQALSGTDRFVVGIRQLPSDEIEVTIDSDTTVGIDDCIALSRAVTGAFDRDAEDFARRLGMGIADFFCAVAGQAAVRLCAGGESPVVFVVVPRR